MKPALFLRIASLLTLIHAALHTVGGVFSKPSPGTATMVAATMRSQFPFLGGMRSYADFYRGMGLAVSIFLVAEAIAFWLLASLARKGSASLRPLLAVFALGYLALALNSYAFFFLAPVIVETLIATCLIAAIFTATSADEEPLPAERPIVDSARG